MSNHSFNVVVVPLLQPDPAKPDSTVDPRERGRAAMTPRRDDPQTGFSLARATGSAELREMLDLDVTSSSGRPSSPHPPVLKPDSGVPADRRLRRA